MTPTAPTHKDTMIIVLPLGLIILLAMFIVFVRFSTAINRRDAQRRSIPPSPLTHPHPHRQR